MASGRVPKTNIIVFIKIDDYFVWLSWYKIPLEASGLVSMEFLKQVVG